MNDWKRPISVMLGDDEVKKLDILRNGTPRSAYLRALLDKHLEANADKFE